MQGDPLPPSIRPRRNLWKSVALGVGGLVLVYLLAAYLIVPALWKHDERHRPSLDGFPRVTQTAADIPGDPLNVALIGTKPEVIRLMLAAQWHPADPLTFRSSVEMVESAVLKRSYEDAPVSNLFLFGRKEDLAFEQQVGPDPRHRHHVRFWQTDRVGANGRPLWVGSAVYDERVGLSRTTGQVTHVTGPDVDAERDYLFQCLEESGDLAGQYVVDGFHQVLKGKNGGGDPWYTDGSLYVGVIQVTTK